MGLVAGMCVYSLPVVSLFLTNSSQGADTAVQYSTAQHSNMDLAAIELEIKSILTAPDVDLATISSKRVRARLSETFGSSAIKANKEVQLRYTPLTLGEKRMLTSCRRRRSPCLRIAGLCCCTWSPIPRPPSHVTNRPASPSPLNGPEEDRRDSHRALQWYRQRYRCRAGVASRRRGQSGGAPSRRPCNITAATHAAAAAAAVPSRVVHLSVSPERECESGERAHIRRRGR